MSVFDIADLSRSRADGNRATRRARSVFDTLGEGVIVWSLEGRVVDCNRSAAEILGRDRDQLRRMSFEEVMRAARVDLDPVTEDGVRIDARDFPAIRARRNGLPVIGQVLGFTNPEGHRVWLEVDVRPVRDDTDGDLLVTSFRDVTQRKEAEERMRALSAIVESSSDAIFRETLDGIIESWNPGAESMYGFTAAEAIGQHHGMLVPDDRRVEAEHLLDAARGGTSINNLFTVRRRKDGSRFNVAVTTSPLFDATGTVIGVSEVAGDVSELIEMRDALVQSEEWFRSLVQRSSDVAFVLDRAGNITYASPAAERFGYAPEELVGIASRDLIHPDDVERNRDAVFDAVAEQGSATIEWRFRKADGSYCWVEEVLTDLHDVEAVSGWVANIRDITDRRRAEADRIEAEERYRQGFERSAFGLAVLDLHQTFTSVNSVPDVRAARPAPN
jgi:PAS domain S-box-containing protein